jgi:hypothetical protein
MTTNPAKEFNKRRATFMKLAAADDLPPILVKLAYLIAYQELDLKTQTTKRAHATFAARMGVTPRHIQRLLVILTKRCGLVVQSGRGRHQISTYWIGPPPPEKATCRSTFKTQKSDMEKATPMSHALNVEGEGEAKASPLAGRENEPSVLDSSGSGAALEGPPEPLEEPESHLEAGGTSPSGQRREEEDSGAASASVLAEQCVHAGWRALVELWAVRPWPMTPRELAIARTIFVRLVAEGVPIDAILAGAGAWVRGIDDPRFLMALPQWLQAKGWERGPPPKRMRKAQARGGQRHGYQRRKKTDLASLMHQLGQTM